MPSLTRRAAASALVLAGIGSSASAAARTSPAKGATPVQAPAAEPPRDWIDPDTGHRVVRLSNEAGSASLYFHQNAYLPDRQTLLITTPGAISAVDLETREVRPIIRGEGLVLLFAGPRTGDFYFTRTTPGDGSSQPRSTTIYAASAATGIERTIGTIASGSIGSVNADETLLLGQWTERDMPLQPNATRGRDGRYDQAAYAASWPDGTPMTFADAKEVRLNDRLEARIPMEIFTLDVRTGERKVVHRATDWLNHLQFSPTDPGQIMFCHEGPWHKVDRIWTIRTDGSGLTRVHARTMNMEIAGHEWFSSDGQTIWYDLQTPRGQKFTVAGYNLQTGARTHYHLERDEWSVHFNSSHDGALFAGDGGDAEMVARARDGKWIYLFRPEAIPDVAGLHAPNADDLIRPGILRSERLVNMATHDYRLEPNITFTPDNRWIVFRSNMHGANHVYAVEVAKAA